MSDGTAGRPRTRAEVEAELARAALREGEALLSTGDATGALRWLERASRIAADDDTVTLSRALALLALGDPQAVTLLHDLSRRHDVRAVWLGLAAAQHRHGAPAAAAAAAAALARALSGHRLDHAGEIAMMADAIAARAGAAGWCGLDGDGLVVARANPHGGRVELAADGRPCRTRPPAAARSVAVTSGGVHLLGSPLNLAQIRRVEGFVAAVDGGLLGWAWHPGDAERDPVLSVTTPAGAALLTLRATDTDMEVPRPLSRPRRFVVSRAALARHVGPLAVRGADGRHLTGSPLDPGLETRAATAAAAAVARALPALGPWPRAAVPWQPTPARLTGHPAAAPARASRRIAVVLPVYRGLAVTLECLDAVFATVPPRTALIVVDDASPEPALSAALDALAARGRIRLLRHARNLGFPGAANAGLRAAAALPGGPDVVLLNSDTVPTPGWLTLLRTAVHAVPDIGTAAPLSNDATILSYPDPTQPEAAPAGAALHDLAALAARVHGATAIDIPTSVGFCMYIRRECLVATGLLRTDVFAQGYGEENDFCIRARHLGWRHVAVPGAYVAHVGGQSFGDARAQLMARNLDVLEALHPGYRALIDTFLRDDALAPARRALDAARWKASAAGEAVLLVTHDSGGGVERAVRERCAALAAEGKRAIVLRPVLDRSPDPEMPDRRYLPGLCAVGSGVAGGFANLRFRLPDELPALADLLRRDRVRSMEVHHLLGHHHGVIGLAAALGIPYDVHVHDYAWICKRLNLVGPTRRYCGEPDASGCVACVADAGSLLEEDIAPAALRARSAADMTGARRVVAPSHDTASRMRRYVPQVAIAVVPHEADESLPPGRGLPAAGRRRVGVIGAIGTAKGYDVLLGCARDAAARDLNLSFTVVGHSEDDERLLATGRVFITGPYLEPDAGAVIMQQNLHLAWLPSIWPETWCYALGAALRAGLGAVVFDIGAPAERVRATGRGWLLPLGLPIPAINNALLALRTVAGDECARRPASDVPVRNIPQSITARS